MNVRRTPTDGERGRRPSRKTVGVLAVGAVAFGLALIVPAAGSALAVAAAVVAIVPTDRKRGKGDGEEG